MIFRDCAAVSDKGIVSYDVGGLSKSDGGAKGRGRAVFVSSHCRMHEERYITFSYDFVVSSLNLEPIHVVFVFSGVFSVWLLNAVVPVDLKQTVQVDKDLQIRAYYAGHVRLVYLSY